MLCAAATRSLKDCAYLPLEVLLAKFVEAGRLSKKLEASVLEHVQ